MTGGAESFWKWLWQQSRLDLDKVSRRSNPHFAHLGFDDRGDNDGDEISLKKKNSAPLIAANLKLQRRFQPDPRYATQKRVEEARGRFLCGHAVSL